MQWSRRQMLLTTAGLALPTLSQAADPPGFIKYWVYFGCYTGKDGSKGIYRSELDGKTGTLSDPELAAEVGSPSFLHISPNGQNLYAVGEGPKEGGVFSYKLDPKTGKLSDQVALTSGGNGACHISTDADNQFAVVANYGAGSYAFFKLKADGSLDSQIAYHAIPPMKIDDKDRKALGHCGFFDATGTMAFTCNAGQDKVHLFKIDRAKGTVTPNDPPFIAMPKNCAPRHIHIAPTNDYAFVNGERDMTIHLVKFDLKANKFEVAQSLSTLPDGEKVAAGQSTAEVRIHPNGKFVYVSNRGHNTIAAYKFDKEAMKLTLAGHIRGPIKTPRNFNISPNGKWMLVASQDGGEVRVYLIDQETGLAKDVPFFAKISKCVCIKFVTKQ